MARGGGVARLRRVCKGGASANRLKKNPITHIVTLVVPVINLDAKSP